MQDLWWLLYLLNPGLPVLLLGIYLLRGRAKMRRRLRVWEEDAGAVCETVEVECPDLLARRAQVKARSGPNQVRLTSHRPQDTTVEVEIRGPEGFTAMHLSSTRWPRVGDRAIESGDESFDKAFRLEGSAARPTAARLDEAMRHLLLRGAACTDSLLIGDGRLQAKVSEHALLHTLPILLDIGRRLAEPVSVDRQLAWNSRHDPVPAVRLSNLSLLVHSTDDPDPDDLAVLRDACSDEIPEIRLRAAIELGEEGHGVVRDVAESLADDALSVRAVEHLGRALPLDSLKDILSRARRRYFVQTVRACLEELGRRRDVDLLAQVMAEEVSELATPAARALGMTGEASAEAALLQALQREDDDLREAAVAALGHVGTAAAVPALQEAAERSSLRQAARQAIAEIQSRLEDAAPGQLSLAGAETGQLALASDEAGRLALAPHETGPPAERTAPPARGDIPDRRPA